MAILFTSQDSAEQIQIGGAETITSPTTGGVGPFPRYSIAREEMATGDGTYLNSKYTITITGTATLKSATSQNMLVQGERQRAVQGEALIKALFNKTTWPMHGNGVLEINSYGSSNNNKIKFLDARLISLDLPEQNDETAGVQNLEFSFVFEAYQYDKTENSDNAGASTLEDPSYYLSSAEESFELQLNEDQGAITGTLGNAPNRVYTLTHTLSATGTKKFTTAPADGVAADGAAWRQASQWVKTRLLSAPAAIAKDLMGNEDTDSFDPRVMDKTGTTDMGYDLTGLGAYNHIRQVQSDISAGSYSVTETWIISNASVSARHDLEVTVEGGEESPEIIVTVNGTVQGLDTNSSTTNTTAKYTNAQTALSTILSNTYTIANDTYGDSGHTGSLRNVVLSESLGHNKVVGAITFSRTYDDTSIDVTGAIRQDLTVNYDNIDGTQKVIAILGVLSRADGPIIQDMNTTKERTVSVSLDLTMDKSTRTTKPSATEGADTSSASQIWTLVSAYRPTNGHLQNKTENWNPRTGTYNLSVAWTFNEAYLADPTLDPPSDDD